MNPTTPENTEGQQGTSIMADIGGREGETAAAAPPPRKPKIPTQFVVILAVVAASGAAIWWMKSASSGLVGRLSDLKIIDVNGEVTKLTPQQQMVLNKLDINHEVVQVDPEDITKNPFKLKEDMPLNLIPETAGEAPDPGAIAAARRLMEEENARKEREHLIESEFSKLAVTSIVTGSRPLAIVSGNPVRVGGHLGQFFTVTKIEGRRVTLEADGKEFVMVLETDQP